MPSNMQRTHSLDCSYTTAWCSISYRTQ